MHGIPLWKGFSVGLGTFSSFGTDEQGFGLSGFVNYQDENMSLTAGGSGGWFNKEFGTGGSGFGGSLFVGGAFKYFDNESIGYMRTGFFTGSRDGNQTIGTLRYSTNGTSLTYSNDHFGWFGDGGDRFRTASLSISNSGYTVGTNLFTEEMSYPASRGFIISEIYVNTSQDDESLLQNNAGEFIELTNISTDSLNLKHFKLEDIGGDGYQYFVVNTDYWVSPGASVVFANNTGNAYSAQFGKQPHFNLESVGSVLRFQNKAENGTSKDVISLKDPSGAVIDYVSWNGAVYEGKNWGFDMENHVLVGLKRIAYNSFLGAGSHPSEWAGVVEGQLNPGLANELLAWGSGDISYSYDYMNRMVGIGTSKEPYFYAKYEFDALGVLRKEMLAQERVTRTYDYDQQGRLKTLGDNTYYTEHLFYENDTLLDGTRSYAGLVSKLSHIYPSQTGMSHELSVLYDNFGQVTAVGETKLSTMPMQYRRLLDRRYDGNGNVTQIGGATSWAPSMPVINPTMHALQYTTGTNRLASTPLVQMGGTYLYDANGNVTHHEGEFDVVTYQYDTWLNKSTYRDETTDEGSITTRYAYNSANERMWKQVQQRDAFLHTTKTVYFHGDNPWPLVERETYQKQNTLGTVTYQTHSTVKWHIYGKNGIIATHTNAESIEFPLKDHLGSPRVVLKQTISQGGVSSLSQSGIYAWHPFGGMLQSYGEAEPDYGFTGQEKDHESGLHNFRARTYHEQLGRFFAVDPQGQFHSPYVYGGNNPFMGTDPDGEFFLTLAAALTGQWQLLPAAIGADLGMWQGGRLANGGEINPFKWDWESSKTWGYVTAGGITGGVTGGVGNSIATSGTTFAYTKAMMATSFINSYGTALYTGGKTSISLTTPLGTFSIGKQGFNFNYIGKKGNSWLDNTFLGMNVATPFLDYFVHADEINYLKTRDMSKVDRALSYDEAMEMVNKSKPLNGHFTGSGSDHNPVRIFEAGVEPQNFIDGKGIQILGTDIVRGAPYRGAYGHDVSYFNLGASGGKSAFLSLRTASADLKLGIDGLVGMGTMTGLKNFGWSAGIAGLFGGVISSYKMPMSYYYYRTILYEN